MPKRSQSFKGTAWCPFVILFLFVGCVQVPASHKHALRQWQSGNRLESSGKLIQLLRPGLEAKVVRQLLGPPDRVVDVDLQFWFYHWDDVNIQKKHHDGRVTYHSTRKPRQLVLTFEKKRLQSSAVNDRL